MAHLNPHHVPGLNPHFFRSGHLSARDSGNTGQSHSVWWAEWSDSLEHCRPLMNDSWRTFWIC